MSVVLWLKSLHIAIDSPNDCDVFFGLTQKKGLIGCFSIILENNPKQIRTLIGLKPCFY